MTDLYPGTREQLVKAARMHFLDGRTQHDISRVLGTSPSNVSRMLSAARSLGIVEVRIQDELGRDADLEQGLCEGFGLGFARVAAFRPHTDAVAAAANLAAEWLDGALRDGQILGLSWGRSLRAVVSAVSIDEARRLPVGPAVGGVAAAMSIDEPRRLQVVPLMGGMQTANPAVTGQELVRELAGHLGATYRHLHGPALLNSGNARDALLGEPCVAHVLDLARSADIAVVGIGTVGVGSSAQVLEGLALSSGQYEAFLAGNPVGDTCCRFFDAEGQPVRGPADDRVLAVELDDLRRIPTVVGVATGCDKTAGVLGALRGGILDGLITDAVLAHSVLTAEGVL